MKKTDTNVFLDEEINFSYDKFKSPPVDCLPVYTWCWCIPLDKKATDRDIEEFVRLGIKAVYILPEPDNFRPHRIPTTLKSEYMGEEYLDHYKYAVAKAKEKGISLWIYDEAGWPSGGAGGIVVKDHPEYGRHKLALREKEFKKGDKYCPTDACTAFDEEENIIPEGYEFASDTKVTEYYCKVEISDPKESSDFADISSKEAVEYFIDVTHEKYKKIIGEDFGTHIRAVFTDEPTMPSPAPFSKEVVEGFTKETGFSILPYLPIIARKRYAQAEEEKKAVMAWYDYCSRVFCNNFMKPCKKWCNENGLAFTGHMDMDHVPQGAIGGGNYNLMRALRLFDVPGIDVIWRHIFPMEERELSWWQIIGENKFFPRYASSAATQIGGTRAMTETFGVFGMGLTFAEMRYVLTFQAIRGVNLFNFMLVPYGDPKGFQMTGELPAFKEKYACYGDLKIFNEYTERLSYMTSVGINKCDTALYLPTKDFSVLPIFGKIPETFEFDRVGFGMEDHQIPFDIFDDDVMECADESYLEKGVVKMGYAHYCTLVITDCQYMSEKAQTNILRFISGGGRVVVTRQSQLAMFPDAVFNPNVWDEIESPLKFSGNTDKIRLGHRVADNADIYYISNECFEPKAISVEVGEDAYIVNLTDGIITKPMEKQLVRTLEPGEMIAVMYTDAPVEVAYEVSSKNELSIDGTYTIRKTRQFVIGEEKSYSEDICDEENPAVLGDWRKLVGEEFSGSCVYKTSFKICDAAVEYTLDLGDVRYTCEAFVNGKSLGVKVMAPYRYTFSGDLIKDVNTLEVRVSNTAANEFYHTKSFDKYEEWQLTPYHQTAQEFHAESLESGLYGPVKLLY